MKMFPSFFGMWRINGIDRSGSQDERDTCSWIVYRGGSTVSQLFVSGVYLPAKGRCRLIIPPPWSETTPQDYQFSST